MARIQYYVHGRGRGHAIRTLSAVAELRERGHDVDVAASGVAAQVLASVPNVRTIELVAPGRGMASAFRRRLGADRQWLRRLHPDVVVSDGDGPSVHAALALGIPRLAVGHGLALVHARVPTVAPPFARWRERLNVGSSSWPCPTRVAVHFAPARPRTRGTTIARPDLHAALRGSVRDEGFVLAYFRDGDRHGILRRLAARGERVVAFTHAEVPEGVERHAPSTAGFADHLRRCRAVVGSAGNHLPAEAAMLAKRFLALYRRGDVEQRANAALWRAAKLGPAACFDAVEEDVLTRWLEGPAPDGSAVRAMTPASAAIAAAVERLAVERTVKFQVRYEGRPILSL